MGESHFIADRKRVCILGLWLAMWIADPVNAHHDFMIGSDKNRSNPVIMSDNATLTGNVYIFVLPEAGVDQVRFYIDDPGGTGTPYMVESNAPFDLGGTNGDGTARSYDTTQLDNGLHTLTIEIDETVGGTATESLLFNTDNLSQFGLPPGFIETTVISGLDLPTAVKFAPDGRVFVAEKGGLLKVFDNINDSTATVFADFSSEVWNQNDHGFLGLEVDPGWPARPYVYAMYSMRGNPGGRLLQLEADGNNLNVKIGETLLIEAWCQVYLSHSIGDLNFGPDGALYVTAGDGASFNGVDWGQDEPHNPDGGPGAITCSDPSLEGGALRSQDLQTAGDPVGLSGSVLRLDPDTGAAYANNPLLGGNTGDDRIIAYGLRNPYRCAVNPLNNEVWICDVGWDGFEEINRIVDPLATPIPNFGWPCHEGVGRQNRYDIANLPICEDIYTNGGVTSPFYSYPHSGLTSSASGAEFYTGGSYPDAYDGALFFGDYARRWIKVMFPDSGGVPDPSNILDFKDDTDVRPVDLERGPKGDIFWVNIFEGEVRRFEFVTGNLDPQAVIVAAPTSGPAPLLVQFDGSDSFDPDPNDTIDAYDWDLDGDGIFGDANSVNPSFEYTLPGNVLTQLRVTDNHGATGETPFLVSVDNEPPVVTILSPDPNELWEAGKTIAFSGEADDPETGFLPASAFSWEILLMHCAVDNPQDCHPHLIVTPSNVTDGNFQAIDHEYPSHLIVRLTVTEPGLNGAVVIEEIRLDPNTVEVTLLTSPLGLEVGLFTETDTSPLTRTAIVNSSTTISATSPQVVNDMIFEFDSWSDSGDASHTAIFGEQDTVLTANFVKVPFALVVSDLPDHTNESSLALASVAGTVHIWLLPEPDITQVRYYLNDPLQIGAPFETENNAPWDFAGTNPDNTAAGFDSTTLPDGVHTITASITHTAGDVNIDTKFYVSNNPILPLPPDINLDGKVDQIDFAIMSSFWNWNACTAPDWCGRCDFNKDGTVDSLDFRMLGEQWLELVQP